MHDDRVNTHSCMSKEVQIMLVHTKNPIGSKSTTKKFSLAIFEEKLQNLEVDYALVDNKVFKKMDIPITAVSMVVVRGVFPDELHNGLSKLNDIQHQINFELEATFPNKPHYKMRPVKYEEFKNHVEELLAEGLIRDRLRGPILSILE